MKKILSLVVLAIVTLSLSVSAFATNEVPQETGVLIFEDQLENGVGFSLYDVTETDGNAETPVDYATRAIKSTQRKYLGHFYITKSDGKIVNITEHYITGYFTYDGSIVTAKDPDAEITLLDDGWINYSCEVLDLGTNSDSDTFQYAYATFELYEPFASSPCNSVTVHITCNQNGKTNVERFY